MSATSAMSTLSAIVEANTEVWVRLPASLSFANVTRPDFIRSCLTWLEQTADRMGVQPCPFDILEIRAPRIGRPEEARWIRVKTNSLAASLFPALSRFLSQSQEEFEAKVEGPPLTRDISFDLPGMDPVALTHAIVHYGANNSVSMHFQCIDAQYDHRTDVSYRFAVSATSACYFEDAVQSLSLSGTSLVNMPSGDPRVSATPWPWALPILRRVKHAPPSTTACLIPKLATLTTAACLIPKPATLTTGPVEEGEQPTENQPREKRKRELSHECTLQQHRYEVACKKAECAEQEKKVACEKAERAEQEKKVAFNRLVEALTKMATS